MADADVVPPTTEEKPTESADGLQFTFKLPSKKRVRSYWEKRINRQKAIEEAVKKLPPMDVPYSDPALWPKNRRDPFTILRSRHKREYHSWSPRRPRLATLAPSDPPAPKESYTQKEPPESDDLKDQGKATFEIENVQLLLPRERFMSSTFFSNLFTTLDTSPDPQGPIVLKDVSAAEFGALVKHLYPETESDSDLTFNEWTSVLKLSTRWGLLPVRKAAIRHFLELPDRPYHQKLLLGQEFHSKSLVQSAYTDLLLQPAHMSETELENLGVELMLRLAEVRERAHDRCWQAWNVSAPSKWHQWANHSSNILFQDVISDATSIDLIEQITFARDSGLLELFQFACAKLAERAESLSVAEFGRLGNELGLKVLKARLEFRRKSFEEMEAKYGGYFSVHVEDFVGLLEEEFAADFEQLDEGYHASQTSSEVVSLEMERVLPTDTV